MAAKKYSERTERHNTVPLASGDWQAYHETVVRDAKTGEVVGRGSDQNKGQSISKAHKDVREKGK
ncbi:MAG: hypothetical protein Q8N55_01480 [bacterium]|nr:hypothetical protein [bacterium]